MLNKADAENTFTCERVPDDRIKYRNKCVIRKKSIVILEVIADELYSSTNFGYMRVLFNGKEVKLQCNETKVIMKKIQEMKEKYDDNKSLSSKLQLIELLEKETTC